MRRTILAALAALVALAAGSARADYLCETEGFVATLPGEEAGDADKRGLRFRIAVGAHAMHLVAEGAGGTRREEDYRIVADGLVTLVGLLRHDRSSRFLRTVVVAKRAAPERAGVFPATVSVQGAEGVEVWQLACRIG